VLGGAVMTAAAGGKTYDGHLPEVVHDLVALTITAKA
jgi:hypothetical protein